MTRSITTASTSATPAATPAAMSSKAARIGLRLALLAAVAGVLPACSAQRLSELGQPPALSAIQDPQAKPGYQPVNLPMPTPSPTERNPNSLWRTGSKAFFKDQRAAKVGDIMTVLVSIDDKAAMSNQTNRSRDNSDKAGLPNLFGLEGDAIKRILPNSADPASLLSLSSAMSNQGKGQIDRKEQIDLRLAGLVTQILPNGNLVLEAHQEVRVNYELRDLIVKGVVRPEDITADNTIKYDQIAEARISYGGRGQVSDVQQPRYGQQLLDIVMPW